MDGNVFFGDGERKALSVKQHKISGHYLPVFKFIPLEFIFGGFGFGGNTGAGDGITGG